MLDRSRTFKVDRYAFAALVLVLGITGCSRRDEGAPEPGPKPVASAAPQGTSAPGNHEKAPAANDAEPQPDFIKHPPVHLKPPCASTSAAAAKDGGNRCVTLTLRCAELDRGEPVWLLTSPALTKVRLPEGAKGLRVSAEDEVSATVCCKAPAAEKGPVQAQIRLFTDDVAGATHAFECP
ncbi:hypothetical protein [Polyangium fumosum]|uniref:Uncharacterized protein n=1 Tax=Polyangium fumosum TaxID=889272 RepID=A0A4U1J9G9_9BACT|nr:hypothetical protein [Polyangium fumosum]TKD05051.1 hypothetical protein E8A74_22565 [Polyangium fumosum]